MSIPIEKKSIRLCVLGEVGVGKSSVVLQFTQHHFPTDFDPSVEDVYTKDFKIGDASYKIEMLDTGLNDDQYSPMKEYQIEHNDGFIIIFSLTSINSLRNAANYHRQIINARGDLPPCILIGNKLDAYGEREVETSEAEKFARDFEFNKYFEVSAKNNENIVEAIKYLCEITLEEIEKNEAIELEKQKGTILEVDEPVDSEDERKKTEKEKEKENRAIHPLKTKIEQDIGTEEIHEIQETPTTPLPQTQPTTNAVHPPRSSQSVRALQSSAAGQASEKSSRDKCCIIM